MNEPQAGFYRLQDGQLLYARIAVWMPDGTVLKADKHDSYLYPVNGWQWFDSAADAYAAHGLEPPTQ